MEKSLVIISGKLATKNIIIKSNHSPKNSRGCGVPRRNAISFCFIFYEGRRPEKPETRHQVPQLFYKVKGYSAV